MTDTATATATFEKLERNGKVAILYSPGFGAGWYTWNTEHPGLVFDREVVEAVLGGNIPKAVEIAHKKYGEFYDGGSDDLDVMWLPKGSQFEIDEYNGSESVHVIGGHDYLTA